MKKPVFIILFLFVAAPSLRYLSIQNIRKLYLKAGSSKKACKKLIMKTRKRQKNKPLFLGYEGSAFMMMAGYGFNPFKKLADFKKGKKMLAKAIKLQPRNAELHFLRLAAQTQAPSFLDYHGHIHQDKQFLKHKLPELKNQSVKKFLIEQIKNLHLFQIKK
jgi:hypothetical protein